jgi:hypothetical protein
MWPRSLTKPMRVMALFGKVPPLVDAATDLQHIVRAVRWFQTVDTPTCEADRIGFRAAQELVSRELERLAGEIDRKVCFMAELIRMRDGDPLELPGANDA